MKGVFRWYKTGVFSAEKLQKVVFKEAEVKKQPFYNDIRCHNIDHKGTFEMLSQHQ